jgi:hypothetical protein
MPVGLSALWPITCIIGLRLREKIQKFKEPATMSIEKKSLISTLKTTKKANVVSSTTSPEPSKFSAKILKKRAHVLKKRAHVMKRAVE